MVVGAFVSNCGSDGAMMSTMHEQIKDSYGIVPRNFLVDCGYPSVEQITAVERGGSCVHAPIFREEDMISGAKILMPVKCATVTSSYHFRQRMSTPEAKAIYKSRPSIVEYINAELRNRGLYQFAFEG